MTIEAISGAIGAIAAVISLVIKLHEKYPRFLTSTLEAVAVGIPFGFIPKHLVVAIVLFTLVQTYEILKELRKPTLLLVDAFVSMGSLVLKTGLFAACVAYFKF